MVIQAQDFSTRYPLVDGHGNFGSVDGDGAAAYRYTEARLSRVGNLLMENIEKGTVDFRANYDSSETEPCVLPTMFPNLLANGCSGIAVGMATNMAPHNLTELYDAMDYIITQTLEGEEADENEIIKIIKAPDFPTGGQIIGLSGVKESYLTGRGRIIVRSKYVIEENKGKLSIVFYELPYKVNKARLVERIDALRKDQIPMIKEVRDESDKDGIRLVVELKKDANVQFVVNKLLKHSDIQTSFSVNNVVLVGGQPRIVTLKDCLELFMAHAAEVVIRKSQYELEKANTRINLVNGIVRALENIDQVIEIIKESENPVTALVEELEFNEDQAKAIADMRLRALTHASFEKYSEECSLLTASIAKFNDILNSNEVLLLTMRAEFNALKDKYGDKRRTEIVLEEGSIEEEDLVKEEMLIVTFSSDGLIKAVEESEYRTQNRGTKGAKATKTKDDEVVKYLLTVDSKDTLLFMTDRGRCHSLKAYKIQKTSRTARGKSINNYLNLENESIITMIAADSNDKEKHLLFVTKKGILKRLAFSELSTRLSVTKVMNFKEDDSLVAAEIVEPENHVMITTAKGQGLRIEMSLDIERGIRPMGRQASGVIGIKLGKDDYVVDMSVVSNDMTLFTITESGMGKRTPISSYPLYNRGSKGVVTHKISAKTGLIVSALTLSDTDEVFVATEQGLVIRIASSSISKMSRSTAGVKVIDINEGDKVGSVSKGDCEQEEEKSDVQ